MKAKILFFKRCKIQDCKKGAGKSGFCGYHWRHNKIWIENGICKMTVFCGKEEFITSFDTKHLSKVKKYR